MQTILKEYAAKPQSPVSLYQMLQYGTKLDERALFAGSVFLMTEIPIRLAHRIVDLDSMPNSLGQSPMIQQVRNLYMYSLEDCIKLPLLKAHTEFLARHKPYESAITMLEDSKVNIQEYNKSVHETLTRIKSRHDNVVELMARGVQEHLRSNSGFRMSRDLQKFLENFYLSRIGIRCLIGHHVALFEQHEKNEGLWDDNGWVGVICKFTNVLNVCKNAFKDALYIFENKYGPFSAPKVTFHVPQKAPKLRYIPSHLHHIIFELAKNSLRATHEVHAGKSNIPDIKLIISEGSEDVTIKVSDEGGGIPRSAERLIWSFGYTTAELQPMDKSPLAGFGYGLPLSKLYARYFGGDLKVISMDGYGTDAYLNLCRLTDYKEPIIP